MGIFFFQFFFSIFSLKTIIHYRLSSENLRKLALQEQLDDIYFQSQPSMIEQHQQQQQESFQLNTTSPASITSNNFNINDNTNNISIGTNDSMNIIANNESVDVARRAEFKHSPPKQHQSTHHCTATASTSTIEMEKTNLTASSSSSVKILLIMLFYFL